MEKGLDIAKRPNPQYTTFVIKCVIYRHGRWDFENQENRVDEDAQNGRKDDGGDAVGKQNRYVEGKHAVGQRQVTADTANQDDHANCELPGDYPQVVLTP